MIVIIFGMTIAHGRVLKEKVNGKTSSKTYNSYLPPLRMAGKSPNRHLFFL